LGSDKRVLLTTVYSNGQYYDYVESNATFPFRMTWIRKTSYGLRFLKQNVPEVEILEYPTREEYLRRLEEGWDVVGFSFYLNEIPEILEMADLARRKGVGELWAGNYGALTPGMEEYFDRIFRGYAEEEVASFFGRRIREVVHPPLLGTVGTTLGLKLAPVGVLFTTRGCPMGCRFCQTPIFCPRPRTLSLRSIERVLECYRELGVGYVIILDENFGLFRSHAEEVAHMLGEYGFMWGPMIRADLLLEKLEEWRKLGMRGALFGIESFDQRVLDDLEKKERAETVKEVIRRIRLTWGRPGRGIGGIGYYMIGHEEETRDSIKGAFRELRELNPGFVQLCILTPLPGTPLWDHLEEEYGIFERDWHRFDCKHLVWNHPHLSPGEMEALLAWGMREINSTHLFRHLLLRSPEYLGSPGFYLRNLWLARLLDQRLPLYFPRD
jgi:radical SAM superfamily enzyme YgiQ (UPF0313 family)